MAIRAPEAQSLVTEYPPLAYAGKKDNRHSNPSLGTWSQAPSCILPGILDASKTVGPATIASDSAWSWKRPQIDCRSSGTPFAHCVQWRRSRSRRGHSVALHPHISFAA